MFDTVKATTKRWKLMRRFKCFNVKYHSEQLGKAMANVDGDFNRNYHHEQIHDTIQQICAKNNIGQEELSLIEVELNDYINDLVRAAHDEESRKLKAREFVDTHIKIKRVEGLELDSKLRSSES